MYKILFYEVFEEEQRAIKKHLPFDVAAAFSSDTVQSSDLRPTEPSIICTRTQSIIPNDLIDLTCAVFTRSQGYDHLQQFMRATNQTVPCGYLNTYCATAVAEQALLLMLSLMRRWKTQIKQFEYFNRDGITGEQAYGKKVLVVGVGAIGYEIVRLVRGIGMLVKGVDPRQSHDEIEYVSIEKGIAWADIIFCAADLNKASKALFNYQALSPSKKHPYIINISRGEITPTEDMKRLLDEQLIKGLAMDVFENEKSIADALRKGSISGNSAVQDLIALKNRDNVVFTPHNAFNTRESLEEKSKQTVEAITFFLKNKQFPHPVKL